MGSSKDKFRDFAVAFWKTSKKDLERAQDALYDMETKTMIKRFRKALILF
jgi:hypothetical protein